MIFKICAHLFICTTFSSIITINNKQFSQINIDFYILLHV